MTLIPRPEQTNLLAHFQELTTEQLREELAGCLRVTATNFARLALIVKALEDRGEDLSALKIPILHHLRRVACGQVLPEVLVRFAGSPSLITIVGNLPLPDQKAIAEGQPVRLVVYGADGNRTHRLADPLHLSPEQVRQVFARDHVRTDAEQCLLLDQKRERSRLPRPESAGRLKLDHDDQSARIGRYVIPLADLEAAVKALRR